MLRTHREVSLNLTTKKKQLRIKLLLWHMSCSHYNCGVLTTKVTEVSSIKKMINLVFILYWFTGNFHDRPRIF